MDAHIRQEEQQARAPVLICHASKEEHCQDTGKNHTHEVHLSLAKQLAVVKWETAFGQVRDQLKQADFRATE